MLTATTLLTLLATAVSAIPGNWVEYSPGTCNLVISSPHGGAMLASEMADRTDGCLGADGATCRWEKGCTPADVTACRAATDKDSYTQEIAALVVSHLSESHSCVPHFVRSNLHRIKLDPNRDISEGAQGDPLAEAAWKVYHDSYMVSAVESVRAKFGRGLVFDIHGQGHSEQWTEIGYLLSKTDLNSGPNDLTRSSIRSLAARSGGASAADLTSGRLSFGYFLESLGYKTVPSPSYPSPGNGNYFNGGYTTKRYGSRNSGDIDAIQVEIPNGIRFDPARRDAFARDLAGAISEFRRLHGYN